MRKIKGYFRVFIPPDGLKIVCFKEYTLEKYWVYENNDTFFIEKRVDNSLIERKRITP